MSKADKIYKDMLRSIIETGTDTSTGEVRPKWQDGTPAYTIKKFGVINKYDLREEFPAITLRNLAWKSCIDEMLWIWQKCSNNINELNSHIWDQWADEDGTIGKSYGYQVGRQLQTVTLQKGREVKMNQICYILHELKYNPFSRRIIGNLYNIGDLDEMNLHPCCYSITCNVTVENDQKVLNMILNQRSLDTIVAGGWDLASFAALQHALAYYSGMIAGELIHVIADAHIYDRHIDIAKELLTREEHEAPKFVLNTKGKGSFFDLKVSDFILEGGTFGEPIKNIPVAI